MADKTSFTFFDAAGRPTGIHVSTVSETAANFDSMATQRTALGTALAAISNSAHYQALASSPAVVGTPANNGGVRGVKALIKWFSANEGDNGQYGSNEIGCIDDTLFTAVSGKLVLQGALYDAIKAAFDALVVTENENAVSVYEIEQVTRTL